MPLINTENETAFQNINNSREGSINTHHYERSFDLFNPFKERKEVSGPFSPGNPTVKKQFYRYNLM